MPEKFLVPLALKNGNLGLRDFQSTLASPVSVLEISKEINTNQSSALRLNKSPSYSSQLSNLSYRSNGNKIKNSQSGHFREMKTKKTRIKSPNQSI